MSRIAGPDNEQELLDYALKHTALQVENHCRTLRNGRPDLSTDDANRVYRARYLSRSLHDDGSMTINMELPREMGELVMKAVEIAMAAQATKDHDLEAEADSYYARQADALVDVARDYLAGGSDKPARNGDNYTVMVHVDESALAGQGGESDLPIETIRRITCDCSLLTVVKDKHGNPLDVGRKRRIVPTKIRRAVEARDRTCCFPGCSHTRHLQPHHVIHWADGGETKITDLVSLCSRHHRLHHEGGYTVHKAADGGFCFRNADGRVIPVAPPYRGVQDDADIDASRDARVDSSVEAPDAHASRDAYINSSVEVSDENSSRDVPEDFVATPLNQDPSCGGLGDENPNQIGEPAAPYIVAGGLFPLRQGRYFSLPAAGET